MRPALALLRKKTKEEWTEKHRNVARKLELEVQKKLFDNGWSHESKSQACHKEPQKKEWKWQRGIVTHPLSESQWNRGHISMNKWESEKHKRGGMPAEGFKGHVATDGSLMGAAGKWEHVVGGCNWIMVMNWAFAWDVRLDGGRICSPAHHQEGGADSIPLSSQESNWIHVHVDNKRNHGWSMETRKRMHRSEGWRC